MLPCFTRYPLFNSAAAASTDATDASVVAITKFEKCVQLLQLLYPHPGYRARMCAWADQYAWADVALAHVH